jgi:hypothetical protein
VTPSHARVDLKEPAMFVMGVPEIHFIWLAIKLMDLIISGLQLEHDFVIKEIDTE